MNLFSGLSAFGFRFRDQREQTAEGDGGGDAAGRACHAAGKHADEAALRDRLSHALGERVAEPEQGDGRAGSGIVDKRLIDADGLQKYAEHDERHQNTGGRQFGAVDEDLTDRADCAADPECVKVVHAPLLSITTA